MSSKKPSDVEQAFVSDTAQHYSENGDEKSTASSLTIKEPINIKKIKHLDEALLKIQELEMRLKDIEFRIPKKYPEVKFLNYKDRKRILVSLLKG